jgi:hypothetical protein
VINALIVLLGKNVETVARVAFAGALVLGIMKAVDAINVLTIAIATNPIGFFATLILAGVAALIAFADQIKFSSDGMATLQDFGKALWEEMSKDIVFVTDTFEKNFGFIGDLFRQVFGRDFEFSIKGLLTMFAKVADGIVGVVYGLVAAVKTAFNNLPATVEIVWKTMLNTILASTEKMINTIIQAFNSIAVSTLGQRAGLSPMSLVNLGRAEYSDEAKKDGANIANAFVDGFQSVTAAQDLVAKLSVRAEAIAADRIKRQVSEQKADQGVSSLAGKQLCFNQAPRTPDSRRQVPADRSPSRTITTRKLNERRGRPAVRLGTAGDFEPASSC